MRKASDSRHTKFATPRSDRQHFFSPFTEQIALITSAAGSCQKKRQIPLLSRKSVDIILSSGWHLWVEDLFAKGDFPPAPLFSQNSPLQIPAQV